MKNVKLLWWLSGYFLIAALFLGFGSGTLRAQDTYTLVTDASTLATGDEVLIVGVNAAGYYAMTATEKSSRRGAIAVTVTDGVISDPTIADADNKENACVFTLDKNAEGNYAFHDLVNDNYLTSTTTTNSPSATDPHYFTVSIAATGKASIKATINNGRYIRFLTTDFRGYTSESGSGSDGNDIQLYKKQVVLTTPFVSPSERTVSYKIQPTENLNETLSFTAGNLENDLTVSVGQNAVITVSPTTISKETTSFDLTLTTSGLAEGEYSDIITIKSGAETMATVTVNLKVERNYPYKKITTDAELTDGGLYLIVNEGYSNAAGAISGTYLTAVSVSISEAAEIEDKGDAVEFELEKNGDDWNLKNSSGYLKTTSNTSNKLAYSSDAVSWPISFSDGNAIIGVAGNGNTGTLQYNHNNGTNPRFTNYTGTQTSIQLYKKQVPEAPTCDTVDAAVLEVSAKSTSVNFLWEAPASSPAFYTITLTDADETPVGEPVTVTTTECEIDGLTAGTTYHYSIVSNCTENFSSKAVTGTFTTPGENDPELKITAPAANYNFENTDATISWTVENFTLDDSHLVEVGIKQNGTLLKKLYSKETTVSVSLPTGTYSAELWLVNVDGTDTTRVANSSKTRSFKVTMPSVSFASKTLAIKGLQTMAGSAKAVAKGVLLAADAVVTVSCPDGNFSVAPATLTVSKMMAAGGDTITVTYNGAKTADTVKIAVVCGALTDTLTVTVANDAVTEVADIAALRADAKKDQYYKLTGAVTVSDVNYNSKYQNIWIQDATGGMLVYIDTTLPKKTFDCKEGDVLSNIYGKMANYNGLLELTYLVDLPAATSRNNKVDTTLVTVTDLTAKDNLNTYCSKLVRVNGLTLKNKEGQWSASANDTALDANGNVLIIRPTAATRDYIKEEKPQGTFDLVALVGVYNSTIQVSPRYKTDIISLRPSAAKPTFNLKADSLYEEAQMLTIVSVTEGAKIYYTTNGSTPTTASSEYTEAIKIEKNTTVKAIAVMDDMDNSPVATISIRFKVKVRGELVFHEYFAQFDSSINNEIKKMDSVLPGWSGTKVYPGGQCLKLGTGSAKGSLTLPKLDLSYDNGTYFVVFTAQAWSKDATEINLIANGQTEIVSGLDNTSGQYDVAHRKEYAFEFNNGTEETEITFEAIKASNNRFFIDSIRIYQVIDAPTMVVPATLAMSTVLGTPVSQKVTVKGMLLESDVTVSCPTGNFSVEPATLAKEDVMSENGAEFTVTFNATKAADTVEITLTSGELTKTIKVTATAEVSSANEGGAELACRLYPNPTTGVFYVEVAENARMEIFTLGGVVVRSAELRAGKNELRLDQSGIYFVRLTNGNGTAVRRVVVR